jgi:tellurite resistance protein TerA
MTRDTLSQDSLREANRWRSRFSGHGNAAGAAGYRAADDGLPGQFLSEAGATASIDPPAGGFEDIVIGAAWDNTRGQDANALEKLAQKALGKGVDLDLGCLYELQDGTRGAVQGFGDIFGAYDEPPYILLDRDERTGDRPGDDERLVINGGAWGRLKSVLLYVYIYEGAADWAAVRPQIHVDVPGEAPLVITPHVAAGAYPVDTSVCVVAQLENVRGGIRLTHFSEYFASHPAMDRAFGYGLVWEDGSK